MPSCAGPERAPVSIDPSTEKVVTLGVTEGDTMASLTMVASIVFFKYGIRSLR